MAAENKPVYVGVMTRSRSRNQSLKVAPAKNLLEKRKTPRKGRVKVVSPPAGLGIDPPPPTGPIISLSAAECILNTNNNPFYKQRNVVIEEGPRVIKAADLDPEVRHAMEILDMPMYDYDWLLSTGLPNDEQKKFLSDLSGAVKEIMDQEETADYLEGIFRKNIPSTRHDSFMTNILTLQHDFALSSGVGPLDLNDAEVLVNKMDTMLRNIATEAEIKSLGCLDAYILNVWLPEFVLFALQKVMQISYKKAEEVFLTASSFL